MKYMFTRLARIACCLTLLCCSAFLTQKASAQSTIASWSFESLTISTTYTNGPLLTNVTADVGTGTIAGLHSGSAAIYSTPTGNGSAHGLSANTWSVGDYWQIAFTTIGTNSIGVTWDQTGSSTGPGQFYLAYSTDGASYTPIANTNTLASGVTWSSSTANTTTRYHVDLSGVSTVNNAAVVYLRITDASTTSVGGATVGTAGTDRIDNVAVTGIAGTTGGGGSGFIDLETAANGSGTVIGSQNLTAGSSITVYAIHRDASSNFVENIAADSWLLASKTAGVVTNDLVPSGDLKSAVFTGHKTGTAVLHVSSSTLNTTDSGTITVTASSPTIVRVETAADGSGVVVPTQNVYIGRTLTVYSIRRDAYTNFVDNAAATWSLTSTSGGVVSGDLVASGDGKSAVLTGNNNGTGVIHAVVSGVTSVDSGVLTVTAPIPAAVVISQVYGSGGNTGCNYLNDFVELFNRTANPVDITGWSVQYTSSTGTSFGGTAATQISFINTLVVQPYSYVLVQGAFGATPGTAIAIPTPDASNTNLALAGTAGKVALVNSTTALGTVSTLPDSRIVDLVAYGASSPAEGGAPAPTLTATTAAFRNNGGCTDTDNNGNDFVAATAAPRNSATAQNICATNTPPLISAIANQSVATNITSVGPISFSVTDAENAGSTLTLSVTSSNPSLLPTGNIVFGGSGSARNVTLTPVTGQQGSSQVTITVTDPVGAATSTSFYLFVGDGPQLGVLFNENFNADPDGTILSFAGDTAGGIWHTHSGTTYQIITSNLAAQVSLNPTNSEDINAPLTSPVAVNSGATLYLGFTIHETLLPTIPGDYFMHFKDLTSSNFFCKIFAARTNAAAGKYRLGISNRTNNPPNVEFPMDLDTNTTYNVVVRYKVSVGSATMWVNPRSPADTSVTATDASASGDAVSIALREAGTTGLTNAAGSQVIDNIAISTSFTDVAPPSLAEVKASVNTVVLSWPTNVYSYVLETNKLITGAPWGTNSVVPTVVGANYVVTNAITRSNNVFYRLQGQ